jgi:hypothetical protein
MLAFALGLYWSSMNRQAPQLRFWAYEQYMWKGNRKEQEKKLMNRQTKQEMNSTKALFG